MADPNRALFESVVRLLAPVLDELVFVGGCTTGLFITDPAAGGIRPTKDVDAIVDVTSYGKYVSLSERLRTLGLAEDTTPGAPLCRWRRDDLIVDVMRRTPLSLASATGGTRPQSRPPRRSTSAVTAYESSRRRSSSRRSWTPSMDAAMVTSSPATISKTSSP